MKISFDQLEIGIEFQFIELDTERRGRRVNKIKSYANTNADAVQYKTCY